MTGAELPGLADFPVTRVVTTRWSDNDQNGHLNNAVYYEIYDSLINGWLAGAASVDAASAQVIPVVAESGCRFHGELAFPDEITAGLRVERVGRSSVRYGLALFSPDGRCAATAWWVHVYIDRESRASKPIPAEIRAALEAVGLG